MLDGYAVIPLFHLPRGQRGRRSCPRLDPGPLGDWNDAGSSLADIWLAETRAGGRHAMSFRKKLLLLFAATVLLCVAVMSGIGVQHHPPLFRAGRSRSVPKRLRRSFDPNSSGAGQEVARKVESVAASEAVQRIAFDMNRGATDAGEYVSEAHTLAGQQQLDFLELVDSRGVILSSAQWQAKFGYPEAALPEGRALGSDRLPRMRAWPDRF